MENLKAFVEKVNTQQITISGKAIKQNERNQLKNSFMSALLEDLKLNQNDLLEVGTVADGIALNIQNEEIGSFVIVLNATFKNLEFDFDFEKSTFEEEQAEKVEKAKAREEEKARKKAETEKMKEKKRLEKEAKATKE